MKRIALAVVLLAAAAAAALAAPGKDKLKLVRKTARGDRLAVKESQHTETTYHWKGEGEGSAGGEEVEDVQRDFLQEVVKEDPLTLKRDYKTSTRTKGRPKDTSLEPVRTSVDGKTVIITPDGPRIEGGELSKEDRENLGVIEKIAYACLPTDEVGVGDSWKLRDEIGRALFGAGFNPDNIATKGTGKLESLRTVDGKKAARLALKAAIEVKPSEVLPAIQLELKGHALFLVDDGVFAELVLEGPIHIGIQKVEDGHKRTISGDGQTVYKLKAEVVAAAPAPPAPKPLAKDDELARAMKVKCSKGHEFPNRFEFCAQCGRELDKETRRCPGKCAPLLKFCPLCGEPLVPSK